MYSESTRLNHSCRKKDYSAESFKTISFFKLYIQHGPSNIFNNPQSMEPSMNKENKTIDYLAEKIKELEAENQELKSQINILKKKDSEITQINKQFMAIEDKFQTIVDHSPLAILYTDKDGIISTCNKRAETLFGTTKEKLIGFSYKNITDLRMKEAVIKALSGKKSHFEGDAGNNLANMSANFSPSFSQDGSVSGVIGIFEDISERLYMEKERNQLIGELRASLSKAKTLSGLIPICASCKKIRDDNVYLNQLKEYIHRHPDAEFTHGVCPECMKRLYPGHSGA